MANAVAAKRKCDFVAISEPNINTFKLKGKHSYGDASGDTMIYNFSRKYQVRAFRSSECFVCIETDDIALYSVYMSPNKCSLEDFENHLNKIEQDTIEVLQKSKRVIITGDFNAKHPCWGGTHSNKKGEKLLEWIHRLDLVILNDGKQPTCVRPNGKSYIDVTIISDTPTKEKIMWSVIEDESMSDHKFLLTEIYGTGGGKKSIYKYGKTNLKKFNENFRSDIESSEVNYEQCERALKSAYEKSTPRVKCDDNYMLPYWWNENVQNKIKETRQKRRYFQKCKTPNERETLKEKYKVSKRELKKLITTSKAKAWHTLCEGLESDIYGDAYKIVKSQMQIPNPKICLSIEQKRNVFESLFITSACPGNLTREAIEDMDFESIAFTPDETKASGTRIKTNKAPGPDAIPPDIVKSAICNNVEYFTCIFNRLMKQGSIPDS